MDELISFIKEGQIKYLYGLKKIAETEKSIGPITAIICLFTFENEIYKKSKKNDICNENTITSTYECINIINVLFYKYYRILNLYSSEKNKMIFKELTDEEFNGIKLISKYISIISDHIEGFRKINKTYDVVIEEFEDELFKLEEENKIDDSKFALSTNDLIDKIDKLLNYIENNGPISISLKKEYE